MQVKNIFQVDNDNNYQFYNSRSETNRAYIKLYLRTAEIDAYSTSCNLMNSDELKGLEINFEFDSRCTGVQVDEFINGNIEKFQKIYDDHKIGEVDSLDIVDLHFFVKENLTNIEFDVDISDHLQQQAKKSKYQFLAFKNDTDELFAFCDESNIDEFLMSESGEGFEKCSDIADFIRYEYDNVQCHTKLDEILVYMD